MTKRTFKCTKCGVGAITLERVETSYDPHLPDVRVDGLEAATCPVCGEEYLSLVRFDELTRLVNASLIEKPGRLAAGEVRQLRSALGLQGKQLAELLGVNPEHVSRWETGRAPISALGDRLLRMLVAMHLGLPRPDLAAITSAASPMKLQFVLGRKWKRVEPIAERRAS